MRCIILPISAGSLGLASPPAYHSIRDTAGSNSTYLNGVNFASGGAGVSDLTNKVIHNEKLCYTMLYILRIYLYRIHLHTESQTDKDEHAFMLNIMLDLQGQCFSFDHQIERDYSSVHSELVRQIRQPQATAHLSKSIFVVAIGGNDIILRALPPAVELTVEVAAVISLPPQEFIHSLEQTLRRQLQVCADSVCSY
jgi:hypothetical protein